MIHLQIRANVTIIILIREKKRMEIRKKFRIHAEGGTEICFRAGGIRRNPR